MNSFNKITNIIENNIYNNKLLSKQELIEIVRILTIEYALQEYIKKVSFINKKDIDGSYSINNKTLSINYKKHINKKITSANTNLEKNIYLLKIIIHEFYHAKQHKLIDINNDITNLEKERLILELKIRNLQLTKNKEKLKQNLKLNNFNESLKTIHKIKKINKFYSSLKGYTSHFSERQAEYKALEYCEKILSNIDNKYCLYLADKFRREKYKTILFGYKELLLSIKYPLKYFQKNKKIYDPEGIFDLSLSRVTECDSLEKKMLHGFPITKKEFQAIDLEIHTKKILK